MPQRTYNSPDYRYGFNGKEKDESGEFGNLTTYDYGFRIYNPGIGKFLSVDPLTQEYPFYTPYQFAGNKPINSIDLDGLEELEVHSAYWTKKLLEMDLAYMTEDEIIAEVSRINTKGYKDDNSKEYANKYYESKGNVASVVSAEDNLKLTGYTNANDGSVIKFTIYSTADGGAIEVFFPEIAKGMEGQLEGYQYGLAAFAFKYSGYGKLNRALHNYMEGEDQWTGEKGSTGRLITGGATDLVTMGTGVFGALSNQGLNMFQEALEQASPEQLEQIGVGRESIDIATSSNKVELISNIIQAGLVTEDLYNKHRETLDSKSESEPDKE